MEANILLYSLQANAIDSSEQQEPIFTDKYQCFAPNYFYNLEMQSKAIALPLASVFF